MAQMRPIVATALMMALLGCSEGANESTAAGGTPPPQSNQKFAGVPACNATVVEMVNYKKIYLGGGRAVFENGPSNVEKDSGCSAESIGFQRYLMDDGSWVEPSQLNALQKSGISKSSTLVDIVVLRVMDRKQRGQNESLSGIGISESFKGVAFTKWTASEERIRRHNLEQPDRPIGNSPQWSVDGSNDDQTGRPVNISCTPGAESDQQGDKNYLSAGRMGRKSVCEMWFAIDIGKASRVSVKIGMAGEASMAKVAIANVRKELIAELTEVTQ